MVVNAVYPFFILRWSMFERNMLMRILCLFMTITFCVVEVGQTVPPSYLNKQQATIVPDPTLSDKEFHREVSSLKQPIPETVEMIPSSSIKQSSGNVASLIVLVLILVPTLVLAATGSPIGDALGHPSTGLGAWILWIFTVFISGVIMMMSTYTFRSGVREIEKQRLKQKEKGHLMLSWGIRSEQEFRAMHRGLLRDFFFMMVASTAIFLNVLIFLPAPIDFINAGNWLEILLNIFFEEIYTESLAKRILLWLLIPIGNSILLTVALSVLLVFQRLFSFLRPRREIVIRDDDISLDNYAPGNFSTSSPSSNLAGSISGPQGHGMGIGSGRITGGVPAGADTRAFSISAGLLKTYLPNQEYLPHPLREKADLDKNLQEKLSQLPEVLPFTENEQQELENLIKFYFEQERLVHRVKSHHTSSARLRVFLSTQWNLFARIYLDLIFESDYELKQAAIGEGGSNTILDEILQAKKSVSTSLEILNDFNGVQGSGFEDTGIVIVFKPTLLKDDLLNKVGFNSFDAYHLLPPEEIPVYSASDPQIDPALEGVRQRLYKETLSLQGLQALKKQQLLRVGLGAYEKDEFFPSTLGPREVMVASVIRNRYIEEVVVKDKFFKRVKQSIPEGIPVIKQSEYFEKSWRKEFKNERLKEVEIVKQQIRKIIQRAQKRKDAELQVIAEQQKPFLTAA